jgi:Zn-finger protein
VNAKTRGLVFDLSEERFRYLVTQNCSYCGCAPSTVVRTRAGYDLSYIDGNVVSCCGTCNIAKQAMELPVFLAWVERVYAHSVASRKTENIVRITW